MSFKKALKFPNVSGPVTDSRGAVNIYQFQEVHRVVRTEHVER